LQGPQLLRRNDVTVTPCLVATSRPIAGVSVAVIGCRGREGGGVDDSSVT